MIHDVVVCDYGIGNIYNVYRALEFLKFNFEVDSDGSKLSNAKCILIPGVAAFGEGIKNLRESGQFETIRSRDSAGVPIVGLCLGAQMLLSCSAESPGVEGLGLIEGDVNWLNPNEFQSPHQGWSELIVNKTTSMLMDPKDFNGFYFFSHGYYMSPQNKEQILATVRVGEVDIPAVIAQDNKIGIQFHPERSGKIGLNFLQATISMHLD